MHFPVRNIQSGVSALALSFAGLVMGGAPVQAASLQDELPSLKIQPRAIQPVPGLVVGRIGGASVSDMNMEACLSRGALSAARLFAHSPARYGSVSGICLRAGHDVKALFLTETAGLQARGLVQDGSDPAQLLDYLNSRGLRQVGLSYTCTPAQQPQLAQQLAEVALRAAISATSDIVPVDVQQVSSLCKITRSYMAKSVVPAGQVSGQMADIAKDEPVPVPMPKIRDMVRTAPPKFWL